MVKQSGQSRGHILQMRIRPVDLPFDYHQFRPHFAQVGLPPAKTRLMAVGTNPCYQLSGLPLWVRDA
jgi:hypothetical protein